MLPSVESARDLCVSGVLATQKSPVGRAPLQFGVVSVPVGGEDVCGDGWAVTVTADNVFVMVVDGLGHGIHAAEIRPPEIRLPCERELLPLPCVASRERAYEFLVVCLAACDRVTRAYE
jgi:hypothetical protein